ncbi:MAG TPA: transcription-repair coupling factor, partial [Beutenbergiaceae bacterium]|nr:transcription-repair coupling factor [Beutenbergiaceae bacterium]
MTLAGLLPALRADAALTQMLQESAARGRLDISAATGSRPALLADLAERGDRPLVVVTATGREADELRTALGAYLNIADVEVFPAWETLPHERLSPRSDTVARRIAVLRRLTHTHADAGQDPTGDAQDYGAGGSARPIKVLVAPVRAVLQPVVAGLGDLEPVALRAGQSVPMDEVINGLRAAAYTRVDMVERRGEFAVRGGLL